MNTRDDEPRRLSTEEWCDFLAQMRAASGLPAQPERRAPIRSLAFHPSDWGPEWVPAPLPGHRPIEDFTDDELEQELFRRWVRRHKETLLAELGPELAQVFVLQGKVAS